MKIPLPLPSGSILRQAQATGLKPSDYHTLQMENLVAARKVKGPIRLVLNNLRNIFTPNQMPDRMRDYAPLTEQMNADAGNPAGLLSGMNPEEQQ